jgi:3-oxoacyl-[acyl-carrier protein] reductase
MRNLSTILGPDKIHVNLLSPGCIRDDSMSQEFIDKISKLIPLGRPGSKKELEIPLMVLLHAHDCYLTGQSLIIDGGRTII